jgi:multidrug resistance protein MdtO
MRRDLMRSGNSPEMTHQFGAVVVLVGRLIDIVANLAHVSEQPSQDDLRRFGRLADRIDALARSIPGSEGFEQEEAHVAIDGADSAGAMPLLSAIERTVENIAEVLSGAASSHAVPLPADTAPPRQHFLVADALTNSDHIRFAIRGGLAAAACYLAYNLIAWPGISGSLATVFITALSTVGSSRQKQVLRFGGAVAGGLIGLGAQVFILPSVDSITGFFLLFLAVTIFAAWIAVSGPRLSYFGIQVALAFYLINLQEFKFQTSLAIARDRVVGILIGLLAMWLIFDQLWEASAIQEMKRTFVSTLHLMSNLMREPVSADQQVAIARGYSLRETTNSNFEKLRQEADGVALEFGSSRDANMALRGQMLDWQVRLRVVFIARVALLKFRMPFPGFELPEPVLTAQQTFDSKVGDRIDSIADCLLGKSLPEHVSAESLLPIVEKPIRESILAEPSGPMVPRLKGMLQLSSRIDVLVAGLANQIAGACRES